MPRIRIGLLLLLTACLLPAASCKKKGIDLNTIKIATVDFHTTSGQGAHYRITYDTHNSVDSIIGTGTGTSAGTNTLAVFTYVGSSFNITDAQGNPYFVAAATNGLILKVEKYDTMIMTYKGNQLDELDFKVPSSTPPYYLVTGVPYYWANGDITSYGVAGANSAYKYNSSRSGQVGDAIRINDFLTYGRPYKLTSHLPTELSYTHGGEQYFYTFDGNGRISTFMKVVSGSGAPNDTSEYAYTYY